MKPIESRNFFESIPSSIALRPVRLHTGSAAGLIVAALVLGASTAWASLGAYDAAIVASTTNGLAPVTTLTNAVTLTGTGGVPFNFGATAGDATMEFILEGNPTNATSCLAVGANSSSSLRYELWDDVAELAKLGITQDGVADYLFDPKVPSPGRMTHLAFAWEAATQTMRLYWNGVLASVVSGVDVTFALPTGAGFLGANPDGTEGMVGKIYRVTVYDELVAENVLLAHANAFKGNLQPALSAYDNAITTDPDGLTPVSTLTTPVEFMGTGGVPFDFGATAGDVTMEFILDGDPVAIGPSGFLAVGANADSSNLNYETWEDSGQLGFTAVGVADYLFTPAVPSPVTPTHIAYLWNDKARTMTLYLNGVLAGTATRVSRDFAMPTGTGWLGCTPSGSESMVGSIYRVTAYNGQLSETAIRRHADAFTEVLRPPIIQSFVATPSEIQGGGSAVLSWQVKNATAVFFDGTLVTQTTRTVSPRFSTTYVLLASNDVGVASAKVMLAVNPDLAPYDAAILADQVLGLVPSATLTQAVSLTGAGGVPFNFGATAGDVTMEFILEGDPEATGATGFLAVGDNPNSNLNYETWENSGQVGFTQLGIEDYLFAPPVPSPTRPTHLVFVWNATDYSMNLYVNGILGGTETNVSTAFAMPAGQGFLGSTAAGSELMVGRIYRVVVYNQILAEDVIKRHADPFTSQVHPPMITSFTATPSDIARNGSATLAWEVQNGDLVLLNQTAVPALTNLTVSPKVTTTYTLTVSNAYSTISAKVTVWVLPPVEAYDAAIAASAANGLVPTATLTNAVTLTGSGGVPFQFGLTTDDVTMEFILEGDPVATGASGYLAVGGNDSSSLSYENWNNTGELGFSQAGVQDYLFTPGVASPTNTTHVTYAWNAAALTMTLYVNGVFAGTVTGVDPMFSMPIGLGCLGSSLANDEVMVGRIYRVTVYDSLVAEEVILAHARTILSPPEKPTVALDMTGATPVVILGQGIANAHYRIECCDALGGNWQLLQDIPALSGTTARVEDSSASSAHAQRFYRAVYVQ